MLEQFLQPQLFADNILNDMFPGCWIERGLPWFWAARSCDLTLLDFFALGHNKTQMNKVKIRDL